VSGQAWVVVGLGFGDEGKGTTVDWLARREGARAVVRHGGGPQASHHVVLPDGRWHGFSQFGAATFVPGVATHLAAGMLVSIPNLLREEQALRERGVPDALARLTLDPGSALVTPLHAMLRQLEELGRGDAREGSVGLGVGRAVRGLREDPAGAPLLGDARPGGDMEQKLRALAARAFSEAEELAAAGGGEVAARLDYFRERIRLDELTRVHLNFARAYAEHLVPARERLADLLAAGEGVILEGAQGTLLDPEQGFPPHVTKTPSTAAPARALLAAAGWPAERVRCLGVLRAYAHRHGAGPLPTEDASLAFPEAHNQTNPWQGPFRSGWLDLVLLRHAVRANPGLDGLVVTHLDSLEGRPEVKVCTGYSDAAGRPVEELPCGPHDEELTARLAGARPARWESFADAEALLTFLASDEGLGVPITAVSRGPTWRDKAAP
jgi:adenylosuccinate synthase